MPETFGNLIDRLSICNIKLYMVQDVIHKAAKSKAGLDSETTGRLVSLNLERNRLMTAIDEALDRACQDGGAPIDARVKIL